MQRLLWLTLALALALGAAMAQQPAVGTDPAKVLVDALALAGGTSADGAPQLAPGSSLAFMGDSITAGGGYVRLAIYVLNTKYPDLKVTAINAGISGHKAENMEPRFERDMRLAQKPAVCFINVGINDVWHRNKAPHDPAVLDAYKANVTKMVEKAQAAGAQVVLLTPTIIQEKADNEENTRLVMYVDAMKAVAQEKNCKVADLHALFLNALATKPAGMKITGDGVHMNAYGDALMAIGVLRALGVPDKTIADTDPLGAFQVKSLNMSLAKAAELLEVPPTRFFKPGLAQLLGF
jgi:lysophospholipase L1-like esterase